MKNNNQNNGRGRSSGVAERIERGERIERAEHVARVEQAAQLYGVLPVLEALRAGSRPLERITIAEGAHEHRLREILELARRASVPVRRAPRSELLRLA
ncbi:MAG: hypothetical protein M3R15_16430, partial [Acidobacteriota bacterium]|nr:hypothetical protein [Acidobacteriota bacterium]